MFEQRPAYRTDMLNFISKLFGNKSERDVKSILPMVEKIKAEYAKLDRISNDELRAKSIAFKEAIAASLADIDKEIAGIKEKTEDLELPVEEKVALYTELDKLEKDRDKQLEEVLIDILPEAFAVIKETARRFKENSEITVTATQFDRDLAARKPNVSISGDKAIHKNTWIAAGNEVTWDMVHYDVQLIGGSVLHSGKIAEMATGEGKKLVSTLPAYLNGLTREGGH